MPATKYFKCACAHCGGHIEFPVESTGLTADCPHCGKPTELLLPPPPDEPTVPRRTIIWTMIAVLLLCSGLGGAMYALKRAEAKVARKKAQKAASNSMAAETAANAPSSQPVNPWTEVGFSASPVSLEKTAGTSLVYAVGTLTNLAERQRFAVRVELDLSDSTGEKVGVAKDYQQVIEPKGTWSFRALVMSSKAAAASISSIREEQ